MKEAAATVEASKQMTLVKKAPTPQIEQIELELKLWRIIKVDHSLVVHCTLRNRQVANL